MKTEQKRKQRTPLEAMSQMINLLKRARIELDATARFMEKNDYCQEFTIDYDDTECDGSCLMDDCRNSVAAIDEFFGTQPAPDRAGKE